jgi:hypothetical protein
LENEKGSGEFDEEKPILSAVISGWNSFIDRLPWWAGSVTTVAILGAFTLYSIYIVFFEPVADYEGYLLSPMYSPPVPSPWDWLSPAILVLWIPLGFRLTCYYYRKAYYRAFLWDPPNCSGKAQQREPRSPENYDGERNFWVFNNVHRYFLIGSIVVVGFLWYEAIKAFFPEGGFAIGVGALLFVLNVVLLSGYTFGCHAMRHFVGGRVDCYSCVTGGNVRRRAHHWVSRLTGHHMFWAWVSLFSVWGADLYVRLLMAGVMHDPKWFPFS